MFIKGKLKNYPINKSYNRNTKLRLILVKIQFYFINIEKRNEKMSEGLMYLSWKQDPLVGIWVRIPFFSNALLNLIRIFLIVYLLFLLISFYSLIIYKRGIINRRKLRFGQCCWDMAGNLDPFNFTEISNKTRIVKDGFTCSKSCLLYLWSFCP